MKLRIPGKSSLFTLFISGLVLAVVAFILVVQVGKGGPGQTSGNSASSVSMQVPTVPSQAQPGKLGETGPPTPFPNYPLPAMTPVPPGVDPGFDATPTPGYYVPPAPKPNDPYVLTIGVTQGIATTKDNAELSTLIVDGIVKQVGPARWTTKDGARPANPFAEDNRHYIFTPIVIEVGSSLKEAKGIGSGSELVLLAIGGQVGQDRVEWSHDKDNIFEVGQRAILFIREARPSDPIQTVDNRPLWQVVERYTVTPDGRARNWHSDMPTQQLFSEIDAAVQSTRP
ncbi:MAG TPA: hypothetical protein VJ183_12100 [Chloroflexia bacterium]|nr:hypothetical protein [Chloroflexia bacterium]